MGAEYPVQPYSFFRRLESADLPFGGNLLLMRLPIPPGGERLVRDDVHIIWLRMSFVCSRVAVEGNENMWLELYVNPLPVDEWLTPDIDQRVAVSLVKMPYPSDLRREHVLLDRPLYMRHPWALEVQGLKYFLGDIFRFNGLFVALPSDQSFDCRFPGLAGLMR